MDTPAFSTAKLIGLTGAAWLSGTITSLSLISVPAITRSMGEDSLSATHAARLWRATFQAGFALAPPVAVATASTLVFAGWTARGVRDSKSGKGKWFFAAAALTAGIVPFTIALMKGTNDRLLEFAGRGVAELGKEERAEVRELLGRWTVLNGVRGLLPLAAAVVVGIVSVA